MRKDNSLKKLIISNKHISLEKPTENYYDSLINLVISQFISRSAAISISNKLLLSFDATVFKEDFFENLTYQQIHKLGLSEVAKISSEMEIVKNINLTIETGRSQATNILENYVCRFRCIRFMRVKN